MTKKKKIILFSIGIPVALILVILIIGLLFIEQIVKTGVETIGPKLTGVKMEVGELDISILKGRVELGKFVMGNPDGYKTPYSISLGKVIVHVQPSSLLKEKIVIHELTVQDMNVNFETNVRNSNLTDIIKNLEERTGAGTKKPDTPKKPQDEETQEAAKKKLQIDKIDISNNKVTVAVKGVSSAGASVPLPPIQLANLGTGEDGVTIPEVAISILASIAEGISKSANISIELPEIEIPEIKIPEIKVPEIKVPEVGEFLHF